MVAPLQASRALHPGHTLVRTIASATCASIIVRCSRLSNDSASAKCRPSEPASRPSRSNCAISVMVATTAGALR